MGESYDHRPGLDYHTFQSYSWITRSGGDAEAKKRCSHTQIRVPPIDGAVLISASSVVVRQFG
jgi:hypothetical protein